MAEGSGIQKYCKECGTELSGARYCPQCGAATENAAGQPAAIRQGSARRPAWLLVASAAAVAIVAVIVAVAVVLAHRPTHGAGSLDQARRALNGVISQNRRLNGKLDALAPAGNPGPAKVVVGSAIDAAKSAQRTLGTSQSRAANDAFAATARAAMSSELAWLRTVAVVLAHPGSPASSQLTALGGDAKAKLQSIDKQVPGASASLPSSAPLIAYAHGKAGASQTRRALLQFSSQVQALLTQSQPAYQQINELFRQMQTAASGGTPSITLTEAESTITTVIANRTTLAASARMLTAPAPLAASIRDALAAAMDASLTNDRDISNCLNQANTGTVAFIFKSCLDSTAANSQAATNAKQHFLALYNQLRSQLGQPATVSPF